MKILAAILLLAGTLSAYAGEYRFTCLGEVTGLCDVIYDKDGQQTTIKIDFANPESAALFQALQKARIYGTKGVEDHEGVEWQQGIYLIGDFTSESKYTKGRMNGAPSEPYRDFRVTDVKVAFPIFRFRELQSEDPSSAPVFMETHFYFESLFPNGVKVNDRQIDLHKSVR